MGIRDSVSIVWSASEADSFKHVAYAVRAAQNGGLDAGVHAQAVASGGYAGVVRHASKRKCTDENAFEIMLSSINGVSGSKVSFAFTNSATKTQ